MHMKRQPTQQEQGEPLDLGARDLLKQMEETSPPYPGVVEGVAGLFCASVRGEDEKKK